MKIDEDYLKHVGVLGMRWGHRKSRLIRKQTMLTSNRQKELDKKELKELESKRGFGSSHQRKINEEKIAILKERLKDTDIKRESPFQKIKKAYKEKKDKELRQKNMLKAYNRAVDYANSVLIPKINKKYGKYDWTSLDTSDMHNPKGDPKLVRSYKRYINEYEKSFNDVFNMKLSEITGES